MDFGLGATLYDINTHKFYTPNTNVLKDLNADKVMADHELDQEFEASGNSNDS